MNSQTALPWRDEESFLEERPMASSGAGAGGGWMQQHMAMPRLMGQPAYARPPRLAASETERPFDPDDLPLEAFRTDEERELAATQRTGMNGNGGGGDALKPSSSGGLRGIAARLLGSRS